MSNLISFPFQLFRLSFWKKAICLLMILAGVSGVSYGQADPLFNEPGYHPMLRPAQTASSGFSGTGANINVLYHRIFWRINPDSSVRYIKGSVFTRFVTTRNNTSSISFDLNSVLAVDSVRFRGTNLPVGNITRTGQVLNIALGATLPLDTEDSLTIFYKGTPPGVSGAAQGFQVGNDANAGKYVSTLSESYEDRDWWPCKADMQDKVDSMDIFVSVPWGSTGTDTFWVATNGVLVDSAITGTNRLFQFTTRYPIASYLVFVSVGRFNRYYRGTVNVSGTSVPVVYNLLAGKPTATYNNYLNALDKINALVAAFSNKFGDYPFKLEKHGFYDGLMGAGGMEHQTFSGINTNSLLSLRTLVHELMHQWFGDNVTFGTWNDLWLAEGFARYSEALSGELVPSLGINPFTTRNNMKNSALSLSTTSAWIPDGNILNSGTIWNSNFGSAVYERGAMIVSMLRTLSGDALFYQATRQYQSNLGGSSASTDSLKNYFNQALGKDLTPFFNDYVGGSGNAPTAVGGKGNPVYDIQWSNPSTNRLQVSVAAQTVSSGSNVTYFRSPVVLHVKGSIPAQDTSICFFDWGGGELSYAGNGLSNPIPGNLLQYQLSFNPVTVVYDDSARTLSTGTATKVVVLPVRILSFRGKLNAAGYNEVELVLADADQVDSVQLQRSYNGIDFERVGKMTAIGQTPFRQSYQYSESGLRPGRVFYRALVVDRGRREYSTVISWNPEAAFSIQLQSNPVQQHIIGRFTGWESSTVQLEVLDAGGKLVAQQRTSGGSFKIAINGLPSGFYVLRATTANRQVAQQSFSIIR